MVSEQDPLQLAAVYADEQTATAAVSALDAASLDAVRVVRLAPDTTDIDLAIEQETGAARDPVTRETTPREAAETDITSKPALFVSAPAVAALIILGYGAVIGGTAGVIHGRRLRRNILAGLVKNAVKAGCHVVMLSAFSNETRQRAEAVIRATLPGHAAYT
jgi:hypothetical protein